MKVLVSGATRKRLCSVIIAYMRIKSSRWVIRDYGNGMLSVSYMDRVTVCIDTDNRIAFPTAPEEIRLGSPYESVVYAIFKKYENKMTVYKERPSGLLGLIRSIFKRSH